MYSGNQNRDQSPQPSVHLDLLPMIAAYAKGAPTKGAMETLDPIVEVQSQTTLELQLQNDWQVFFIIFGLVTLALSAVLGYSHFF